MGEIMEINQNKNKLHNRLKKKVQICNCKLDSFKFLGERIKPAQEKSLRGEQQ